MQECEADIKSNLLLGETEFIKKCFNFIHQKVVRIAAFCYLTLIYQTKL